MFPNRDMIYAREREGERRGRPLLHKFISARFEENFALPASRAFILLPPTNPLLLLLFFFCSRPDARALNRKSRARCSLVVRGSNSSRLSLSARAFFTRGGGGWNSSKLYAGVAQEDEYIERVFAGTNETGFLVLFTTAIERRY